jgi:hypothetical protein
VFAAPSAVTGYAAIVVAGLMVGLWHYIKRTSAFFPWPPRKLD